MFHKRRKSPVAVEKVRQDLAGNGDFVTLKKTYGSELGVVDRNGPQFWDELLASGTRLDRQDPMTKDRINVALSFLPKDTTKILDVGAGYGFIEEALQKTREKIMICGIDISPSGIKDLNMRFKGEFKIGDIRRIPYPIDSFDVVFALEVLEHILPGDTFVALKELKRVLAPGGVLIISVPTNEPIKDLSKNPSGHLRLYSPELIKAELFLAGFKLIKWKELYAFKKFYKLKSIIAPFFPQKFQPNNVVILTRKE